MCAWFNVASSSSEDTYDRVHMLSYLELVRAKAHAAVCSGLLPCSSTLCLSWHKDIATVLRLGAERHRAPWPSLSQPYSVADRLVLLAPHSALPEWNFPCFSHRSHSESGSKLITHLSYCRVLWRKSLSLSHITSFSELILLVVPIVWWLPEPWLAVSWFQVSLSSCNETQCLLGWPLGSAASKLWLQMGWEP